jgi:hypothetical protein
MGPDRVVEKMTVLKTRGNELMVKRAFSNAAFVYMLGALKVEDGGDDDADHRVRSLAAQCHCNISLAKLRIGGSYAIVDAERRCSVWRLRCSRRGRNHSIDAQSVTNKKAKFRVRIRSLISVKRKAKQLSLKDSEIT